MRYRLTVSIEVEARSLDEAKANTHKLCALIKEPIVRLSIESEGIKLANGNGNPVAYNPQPAI